MAIKEQAASANSHMRHRAGERLSAKILGLDADVGGHFYERQKALGAVIVGHPFTMPVRVPKVASVE